MKAKFQKRTGGYTPELANNILDASKPIHFLRTKINVCWNIQSFYIISYPSKSLWLSHSRFSEIHEYG